MNNNNISSISNSSNVVQSSGNSGNVTTINKSNNNNNNNPNGVITLYTVYIFDKKGRCLYYWENNRPYNSLIDNPDEEKRLVFGLIFSLKHFSIKLSPSSSSLSGATADDDDDDCSLKTIRTNVYTLHQYESITGYKFVANTSVCLQKQEKEIYNLLIRLYKDVFIPYVLQNPLYKIGDLIKFPRFQEEIELLLLGKRKQTSITSSSTTSNAAAVKGSSLEGLIDNDETKE